MIGIIEKSCIEGQRQYHDDLDVGMRAYMKAHPTEFAGAPGTTEDPTEPTQDNDKSTNAESGQTEAEAYAAKARRKRQEQDLTYFQAALDSFVSGIKAFYTGLKIIFDTIGDLLSNTPLSKEVWMGLVIVLLVLSNLYTYFKGGTREERSVRRMKRVEGNDEMAEALRVLMRAQTGGSGKKGKNVGSLDEEARELRRIVGEVEDRLESLKASLRGIGDVHPGTIGIAELD